ncbi:type VI secretion system-associated protein TagF [Marimonas sp. MJW-29]|uniref:Type VI secretion system-associated protein TagF n=1 Tax=Sulfitobacter sediminis TaxID=3234186 RepID=A0ABV3RRS5_9RHOB
MGQGYGAFGKMPALGDFFQLNAPPGFVRTWDDWLQSAMVSAAEAGGASWDDQYMSAPIWRFALSPGLAGPAKTIGVLMPSVDRVGRRFPLALMAAVDREGPIALDHLVEDVTFEQLEDLALASLEDGMDRDRLAGALAGIGEPIPHGYAPLRRAGNTLVMTQAREDGLAPELAAGLLGAGGFAHPSLWSTLLDGSRRMMICDGLPDAHQARALFDLNAPLWGDARPVP